MGRKVINPETGRLYDYCGPVAAVIGAVAGVASAANSIKARKDAKKEAAAEKKRQEKLDAIAATEAAEAQAVVDQEAKVTAADAERAETKAKRRVSRSSSTLLSGGDTGVMKAKLGS